ncbi:hypothetical protein [Uliginosibacterium sediminicola]|uniref:Uncharacterized protein n=1 Tax=Uliginosibacterium sediminicola TaxID=2024550 RepID=A0ABU9YTN9_9RHOO
MFDILCFASFYLQTPALIGALFPSSLRLQEAGDHLAGRVRMVRSALGRRFGLATMPASAGRAFAGLCR